MAEEIRKRLTALGVDMDAGLRQVDEALYLKELNAFLKGREFLCLGQSIAHRQWGAAFAAYRKLDAGCERFGLTGMRHILRQLKSALQVENLSGAQQVLTLLTQKRVQLRNLLADHFAAQNRENGAMEK